MGGKSKSQTTGFKYSVGAHFVFGSFIPDFIDRIWFRDIQTEAWSGKQVGNGTITINKPDLFGGNTNQGGIVGDIDYMDGNPTQTQNAYLAGWRGALVPSYRGVFSLIWKRLNIGMNPYPPVMGVSGSCIHNRGSWDGLTVKEQWYDAKAAIPVVSNVGITETSWDYKWVSQANSDLGWISKTFEPDDTWTTNQTTAPLISGTSDFPNADGLGNPIYMWYRYNLKPTVNKAFYFDIGAEMGAVDVWLNGNFIGTYFGATNQVYLSAASLAHGQNNVLAIRATGGIAATPAYYKYRMDTASFPDSPDYNADPMVAVNWYISYYNASLPPPPPPVCPAVFQYLNESYDSFHASMHYVGFSFNANCGTGSNSAQYLSSIYVDAEPATNNIITFQQIEDQKYDINPVHIIRDGLTNPKYINSFDEALFPDDVWKAAADQVYAEGFGMTASYDGSTSMEDHVNNIKRHINAEVYRDRKDGFWKIKLIRDDYNIDDLILLNESNSVFNDYDQVKFGYLTTSVTVNYTDVDNSWIDASLTISDIALAQQQGKSININVDYRGVTNFQIAAKAAQRDLNTLSKELITCTITNTNLIADVLNKGSVFKASSIKFGFTNLIMRVTDIVFGDGKSNDIKITAIQDVFALPSSSVVTPPTSSWTPPFSLPTALVNRLVIESPYLELVQVIGQATVDAQLADAPESGYVCAIAARDSNATKAVMYDSVSTTYDQVGTLDFSPFAILSGDIGFLETTFSIVGADDLEEVIIGAWLQVDDEIMCITDIAPGVISVKRGCLDTIPAIHASGAKIWFWDNYALIDSTEYSIGNTVNVKLLTVNPKGQLAIGDAPIDQVAIVGRAAKPYNVANLKINGVYYADSVTGDLVLTWASRNRIQQTSGTIYGFTDGNITPESGVTYTIRILNEDLSVGYESVGVTGTTFTITADDLIGCDKNAVLEVFAVRDGIESYQKYEIPFTNFNSKLRATTTGALRITTDGKFRRMT